MKQLFHAIVLCNALILISCNTSKMLSATIAPVFDKQGHRGCRGLAPENTIPAMLKAIELGVTTLEMDVCFTSDGEAITSHEPYYSHLITTLPDGKFIAQNKEKAYNIYKMTYAETLRYDVGKKPHPAFPGQVKMAATKPRLNDLVDSVEHYIAANKLAPVSYNIETKTNPLTDNLFHPAPEAFVSMLMKIIEQKGIAGRTTIQSFDPRTLQIINRQYPSIKTALLIEEHNKQTPEEQVKKLGFTPAIFSPAWKLVTPQLIKACHELNMKVIPWTVNDKQKITELKNMGVDGIISDFPNLFNE